MIPRSFIQNLIERTDIVSVIGARVPLRKRGANYVACCPFHQEKTPSFSVSASKQIYHCFGCGAGGNVISFLMNFERMEFTEAVENLASALGLSIEQEERSHSSRPSVSQDERQRQIQALEWVTNFYQKALWQSDEAQFVRDYLQKRQISPEMARYFRLGYAPLSKQQFQPLIEKYPEAANWLEKTGMLLAKSGEFVPRFYQRLMFPISNRKNEIIGFGGRTLTNQGAKYINSPDTNLFHKGRELYHLFQARKHVAESEQFFVLEGYIDVIRLVQAGIPQAVAALGTAATTDHLRELLRLCEGRRLVFCFDGDKAGRAAAWRALQTLLPLVQDGIQVYFMFLPEGEDPDSFVQQYGAKAFKEKAQEALAFSDYFFYGLEQLYPRQNLEGKASFDKAARQLLAQIPQGTIKELLEQERAKKVGILAPISSQRIDDLPYEKTKAHSSQRIKPKNQKRASPIRLILVLLLQYPILAQQKLLDELMQENNINQINGFDYVVTLVQIIRSFESVPNLGGLLENLKDHPHYVTYEKLAFTEHLVPEEGLIPEFEGLLYILKAQLQQMRVNDLIEKRRQDGLTEVERAELQNLLMQIKN